MTGRSRTRLEHVRSSLGLAQLALQQIEDDLTCEVGAQELAAILHELQEDIDVAGGLFPALAQLLTVAAQAAGRNAGLQTYYATRALDPQGEAA